MEGEDGMKKTLTLKNKQGTIAVTIKFIGAKDGYLTSDERKHVVKTLVDQVSPLMARAPYMHSYVTDVRVKP